MICVPVEREDKLYFCSFLAHLALLNQRKLSSQSIVRGRKDYFAASTHQIEFERSIEQQVVAKGALARLERGPSSSLHVRFSGLLALLVYSYWQMRVQFVYCTTI